MERYTWNVLGLAEVRWPGTGEIQTDEGHKVWFMGEDTRKEKGVAFIVHKDTVLFVMECRPVTSRLISIRIAAVPKNITIIQAYAPTSSQAYASTSSYSEEDIDSFYEELKAIITITPKSDILIIQGDWNAKVGADAHQNWAGTIGKFAFRDTNDRGLRLLEFARYHN